MESPYEAPKDSPGGIFIQNAGQAKAWVAELVQGVLAAREACNVVYPNDVGATVRGQQRAERTWLLRHGAALGTILALFRCRLLSEAAYTAYRQQIMDTMTPTIVG
jgi:hypothetical protein